MGARIGPSESKSQSARLSDVKIQIFEHPEGAPRGAGLMGIKQIISSLYITISKTIEYQHFNIKPHVYKNSLPSVDREAFVSESILKLPGHPQYIPRTETNNPVSIETRQLYIYIYIMCCVSAAVQGDEEGGRRGSGFSLQGVGG